MVLSVRRLSEPLGAEITGIDLRQPISDAIKAALQQALLDHHFIVVPGQALNDLQHMRFCEVFGEIQSERTVPSLSSISTKWSTSDNQSEEVVGMMQVSNFVEDGILPNGEMWFHSDQCYFDTPCKCTSLHSIVAPKSGGHTRFSNCIKAYETLPEETQRRLDGRTGMNIYDYHSENMCTLKTPHSPNAPRYSHPLARFHPETGNRSLYLNRFMTDHVVDMDPDESRNLLDELFDHMEQEEFIYEHPWKVGDLAIWDNRCLLHARTDFDPSEKRQLRRFAVVGERPI